jgi:hypothetical protein
LAQAIELEAETSLEAMKDLKLPHGRDRLVRHGHGPERIIQTGIDPGLIASSPKIRHSLGEYRASMEFSIQWLNH